MATSDFKATEGSGVNFATYSFTEDAETKDVGRAVLNDSTGTEMGTSGNPVRTDPTGATTQPVSATTLPLPTGAGTSANQTTMINSLSVMDDWDDGADHARVVGAVAHDAVASGNPVLLGFIAQRARASAVSADGDAVRGVADRYGRAQVIGVDYDVAPLDATASGDTVLVTGAGVGLRIRLVRVEASNTHASTAVTVGLKTASKASGAVFGKKYLGAAGGQGVWNFPGGHLVCGDGDSVSVNLSTSGTVSLAAYYEVIAS